MGLFGPPNIERLTSQKDVSGLIKALGYKKDPKVRSSAARALGEIGDPLAVDALLEFLWDDRSTADAAMFALGKINDRRAIGQLVQFIKREMEDEQYFGNAARRNILLAIETVGKFGTDSIEPLTALFPNALKYRSQIITALAKTETQQALEWLIKAYHDWPESRQSIVFALGKSGDDLAVDTLLLALKNPDYELSSSAAQALDSLHWTPDQLEAGAHYRVAKKEWSQAVKYGPLAVEALINVVFDDGNNTTTREAAALALGQIGLPSLEPLLKTLAHAQYRNQPVARRKGMGNVWQHPDMRPKTIDYCVDALVLMGKKSRESLTVSPIHDSKYGQMVVAEALKKLT